MKLELIPMKYKFKQRSMRWAFMEYMDIQSAKYPGFVYLRRLRIIQTPWFGLYVHWIFLPDSDPAPHDHPWEFWTFILKGWYTEQFFPYLRRGKWHKTDLTSYWSQYSEEKVFAPWSAHHFPLSGAHKITDLKSGTITLVAVGKRTREWGFYTDTGFIECREYPSTKDQKKVEA